MYMNLKAFILLVILTSFFQLNAQEKTSITIKLKTNIANSHCLLANHFGSQKYKVDSIPLDGKGAGIFKDKKGTIKGGIYMFVFPTF